jgi:hypothetical protein
VHAVRSIRRSRLLLAVSLVLAAGGGTAHGATAELRVFHARPGAGLLDLQVDGALRLRAIRAATATDYLRLPPGRQTLVLRRSGRARTPLARLRVVLHAGRRHTLVLTGAPTRPALRLLADDRRTLRQAARLRLVHLLPARPALRLVVGGDGSTAVGRLPFGTASAYVRVTAASLLDGLLPVELLDARDRRILTRAVLALGRRRSYSLFVIPVRPRGPLRLVLAQDS